MKLSSAPVQQSSGRRSSGRHGDLSAAPRIGRRIARATQNHVGAGHELPGRRAGEQVARGANPESGQLIHQEADPKGPRRVETELQPGGATVTIVRAAPPPVSSEREAWGAVAPGGGPSVGAGANTCTPDPASTTLAWTVAEADTNNWRPDVGGLTLVGQINLTPWTSSPSSMTVPNTPNPVDGGNLNNTAGSSNHFRAAIDDMADYDAAGGGAGPDWHSTAASRAHEWAHWNQDYVADAVTSAAGGNWSAVNTRIDALREPKASSTNSAAARTALQARVDAELGTWRAATIARWNTLISTTDQPGAGGRGYAAGASILAGLISSVNAYKTAKGW